MMEIRLTELLPGETGIIAYMKENDRGLSGRLRDLGFTENTPVTCVRTAPLGDPSAYRIRGTMIALRRTDAACLLIRPFGKTGGSL